MERWSACPGSVNLCRGIKSRSSRYAEEGTKAHELAAHRLTKGSYPPNTDEEMLEYVQLYVQFVESLKVPGGQVFIEEGFDLGHIHPGLWGTCDAIVTNPKKKLLTVIDFKYGAGVLVEVENNLQLSYYALGGLYRTREFNPREVELVIVQPRCGTDVIRRWTFDSLYLLEFEDELRQAAIATEAIDAPLVPGDHCRWCPASGICPAIKDKVQTLAKSVFSPIASGDAYDPVELSKTLSWLEMVEEWAKSVREFAYSEATSGKKIPGWKLVTKLARRKWRDEEAVGNWLNANMSAATIRELYERPKLSSVASMEKKLSKKYWDLVVEAELVVKESSGNTLAPESDKRPEVTKLTASEVFGELE